MIFIAYKDGTGSPTYVLAKSLCDELYLIIQSENYTQSMAHGHKFRSSEKYRSKSLLIQVSDVTDNMIVVELFSFRERKTCVYGVLLLLSVLIIYVEVVKFCGKRGKQNHWHISLRGGIFKSMILLVQLCYIAYCM